MTYHWKQMLFVCVCFLCASVLVLTAYARAGTTEEHGTGLHGQEGPLALGSWGGQHVNLEVTADGGRAEYDCAHGTISRRIVLDQHGRFKVGGTYVAEHGGPVREGEQVNSIPVNFTGTVSGERMYLTVKRQGSGKLIGSFSLVHGQESSLVKCR